MAHGSYEKRIGADGKTPTWTARYSYEDPVTGKRRHKRLSCRTRKELDEKLAAALDKVARGQAPVNDRLTLREWSERWLAECASRLRPSTVRRYRDLLARHVLPTLGAKRVARLQPDHLAALYAEKLAGGLSPTSVFHLHAVVSGCLKAAVRARVAERDVSRLVKAPSRAEPELAVWSAAQAGAFLAAGDATPLAALWRLAVTCGLRRGELLGLRWEDVDLERRTLAVRRTRSRAGDAWRDGPPKTESSRRSILLPRSCVAALRGHRDREAFERKRLGELWHQSGYVFTGASGQPLHPNALQRRYEATVAAAGVPRIRLHDLRHTCATLLLLADTHPKVVQDRMGHASIKETMDRYSHLIGGIQQDAADAFDAILGPPAAADDAPETPAASDA